jgi:cytochrome c5
MIGTVLEDGRERLIGCGTLIAAAACLLWFAGDMWPAGAQTASTAEEARMLEFGKEIFKSKAVCQYCHKWDASGDQGYGGNALSLRATHLTSEQLTEVVKCGRPGTGMPYHGRFAYTDKRCYGHTREEMGKDMPPAPTISCRNARSTPSSNICSPRQSDAVPQRMRIVSTFGAKTPGNAIR